MLCTHQQPVLDLKNILDLNESLETTGKMDINTWGLCSMVINMINTIWDYEQPVD